MPNTEEKNLYGRFEKWLLTLEHCRFIKLKGGLMRRNEPDYLVVIRHRAVLIEFKRKGEMVLADDGQAKRMRWWMKATRATWCDDLEPAKRIVLEEERIAKLHAALEENISE